MDEKIRRYYDIQTFLNDCKPLLMQKECENNVILGLCNNFLTKSIDPEKFILIAAVDQCEAIISCAVTTSNRVVIVSFINQSDAAVEPLANYFIRHGMNLEGVSGEIHMVHSFMTVYQKSVTKSTTLVLYVMKRLEQIELVQNVELTLASADDISVLVTWLKRFQIDAGLHPPKPDEELRTVIVEKITKGTLYKLIASETQQPVSMVSIVRDTGNFAILSWVYTPVELRGSGFATTAVYKLTELILNTHQKLCALFADKSNSVTNKLYRSIGYQLRAEYLEIDF